ncbi:MAG: glycosyltransferase family 2 protein [Burkholderiales bacterium]
MELAFWCAVVLFLYPYIGYPLLIRILAKAFSRKAGPAVQGSEWPTVTLVISAYNEADIIARKLDNALSLDYPIHSIEVIVVSDASTDSTDAIVAEVALRNSRVRLLRRSERRGKSAGLNEAVAKAGGSIVVFSDANSMYRQDAVREVVKCFGDSSVGYVVGAALYDNADSDAAASEGLYWNMEIGLKAAESAFCSVVGGDGAIYAIRRELFWEFLDDDISDFANPLQIIARGYRGVFNPNAVCFESAGDAFQKEFNRRRRIVNRSFRAVLRYGRQLKIARDARFIFALLSHKVLRWFTFVTFGTIIALNIALVASTGSQLYWITLSGIAGTIVLGLIGALFGKFGWRAPPFVYLSYYFYLSAIAAILGVWDEIRGVRYATWSHIRQRP